MPPSQFAGGGEKAVCIMNAKRLLILTVLSCGAIAASTAWADPPAPTTRPAVEAKPAPAVTPKVPVIGPKTTNLDLLRKRTLRFGLLIRKDYKIIQANREAWMKMTPAERRKVYGKAVVVLNTLDPEKLQELWDRQKEFNSLDAATQKRYRRYARQVHDLVRSLPAHRRSLLMAMKRDERKRELIKIIKEMHLKGQWPPKSAKPSGSTAAEK